MWISICDLLWIMWSLVGPVFMDMTMELESIGYVFNIEKVQIKYDIRNSWHSSSNIANTRFQC